MEFITPLSLNEISQMLTKIMQMDKDTLHTVGYAAYLYIMMDRFTIAPARARRRARH